MRREIQGRVLKKGIIDYPLLVVTFIMIAFGTIMVASASAPTALNRLGDAFYYLKKQLFIIPISLVGMFACMIIDIRFLKKYVNIMFIVTIILLGLVLIPGIGLVRNGARRWLGVGSLPFQPSEIAKIVVVLFFAARLSRKNCNIDDFFRGLVPNLLLLGLMCGLIVLEPHLSGCIIVGATGLLVIFLSGAKMRHFLLLGGAALTGITGLIFTSSYRMDRITAFLDPFAHVQGDGWQIVNSLFAIGSGGLFGRGIGKSTQKYLYLPEPHNDFILAVIAEELGFIGVVLVILLFVFFIYRGIRIAMKAPDKFTSLVAAGLTGFIALEAIINIAVVTSSIPVTGMALPFFSYGGTSLLFLMASVGLLLNISRYSTGVVNLELLDGAEGTGGSSGKGSTGGAVGTGSTRNRTRENASSYGGARTRSSVRQTDRADTLRNNKSRGRSTDRSDNRLNNRSNNRSNNRNVRPRSPDNLS